MIRIHLNEEILELTRSYIKERDEYRLQAASAAYHRRRCSSLRKVVYARWKTLGFTYATTRRKISELSK